MALGCAAKIDVNAQRQANQSSAEADDVAPVALPDERGLLSGGYGHVCAVKADGTLACWGCDRALLGDGPQARLTPPEGSFRGLTVGYDHACGARDDGTVVCWGHPRVTAPDGLRLFIP
ncbi:MAG: hypothetical protein BGO98_39860 [Myxococcales bacterium 68-20]|nr:hypothetical protein [Myxococcales bacterium]OJY19260.1 MAG: hypothetical protein BGO98_39860 [Myxococcales bacterium 68-20]